MPTFKRQTRHYRRRALSESDSEPEAPYMLEPDTPGPDIPDTPCPDIRDTPGPDMPDTPGPDIPDTPGAHIPSFPGPRAPDPETPTPNTEAMDQGIGDTESEGRSDTGREEGYRTSEVKQLDDAQGGGVSTSRRCSSTIVLQMPLLGTFRRMNGGQVPERSSTPTPTVDPPGLMTPSTGSSSSRKRKKLSHDVGEPETRVGSPQESGATTLQAHRCGNPPKYTSTSLARASLQGAPQSSSSDTESAAKLLDRFKTLGRRSSSIQRTQNPSPSDSDGQTAQSAHSICQEPAQEALALTINEGLLEHGVVSFLNCFGKVMGQQFFGASEALFQEISRGDRLKSVNVAQFKAIALLREELRAEKSRAETGKELKRLVHEMLEGQMNDARGYILDLEETQKQLEADNEQLQTSARVKGDELAECKRQIADSESCQAKCATLENELRSKEAALKEVDDQIEGFLKEQKDLDRRLQRRGEALKEKNDEIQALFNERQNLQTELHQERKQYQDILKAISSLILDAQEMTRSIHGSIVWKDLENGGDFRYLTIKEESSRDQDRRAVALMKFEEVTAMTKCAEELSRSRVCVEESSALSRPEPQGTST